MKNARWFEDAAETISGVVGPKSLAQSWAGRASAKAMDLDALSFGFRLGLVSAPDAVAVELSRIKLGVLLTPVEEEIALALSDETRRVEELLASHPVPDDAESDASRLWFYLVLCLARERWTTEGEPQLELKEIEAQWGATETLEALLKANGVDNFYFGSRARERLLARVDSFLAEEGLRWT